jgi:hypothetical protein
MISTNKPPEPSNSDDFINCSKVLEYKDDLSFILSLLLKLIKIKSQKNFDFNFFKIYLNMINLFV